MASYTIGILCVGIAIAILIYYQYFSDGFIVGREMVEKRAAQRLQTTLFGIFKKDGQEEVFKIRDASPRGLCVMLDSRPRIGQILDISIPCDLSAPIELQGRVVWRDRGGPGTTGLSFSQAHQWQGRDLYQKISKKWCTQVVAF